MGNTGVYLLDRFGSFVSEVIYCAILIPEVWLFKQDVWDDLNSVQITVQSKDEGNQEDDCTKRKQREYDEQRIGERIRPIIEIILTLTNYLPPHFQSRNTPANKKKYEKERKMKNMHILYYHDLYQTIWILNLNFPIIGYSLNFNELCMNYERFFPLSCKDVMLSLIAELSRRA